MMYSHELPCVNQMDYAYISKVSKQLPTTVHYVTVVSSSEHWPVPRKKKGPKPSQLCEVHNAVLDSHLQVVHDFGHAGFLRSSLEDDSFTSDVDGSQLIVGHEDDVATFRM